MRRLWTLIADVRNSRTARRFAILTVSRAISSVLQAITFAYVARLMGLDGFGTFSIAYSSCLLAMSFFEFGLGNRSLRVASDPESSRVIATIVLIRISTNSLVLTGVITVWLALSHPPVLFAVCLALYVTGDLFGNLMQSLLIGLNREYLATIVLVTRRVVPLGFLIWFGLFGDSGQETAYVALAITGGLGYILGLAPILRLCGRPYSPVRFISQNHRFATTSLASNIQQADSLVVGLFGGTLIAGLYGAAVRLAAPLNLVTGSVMQSVVPSLASMKVHEDRAAAMRRVISVMTVFAVVLAAMSVLSPLIVTVLYGEEFYASWPLAAAVIVVAAINSINQPIFGWYYAGQIPTLVPVLIATTSILTVAVLGIGSLTGDPIVMGALMVVVAFISHLVLRRRFRRDLGTANAG